eukprot:gnl/Dysnectes_brevis/938_a1044_2227.p1 GENE.gnl/Dysnectes_brevis/938_a1044_2227~~gnl/Dysnectes_brevis/938_a1044_2227.p1  ORF type:complete len:479 (+),score=98.50 gnl/Dysnectes_brevis/938_a1044_2227:1082-2518(+)
MCRHIVQFSIAISRLCCLLLFKTYPCFRFAQNKTQGMELDHTFSAPFDAQMRSQSLFSQPDASSSLKPLNNFTDVIFDNPSGVVTFSSSSTPSSNPFSIMPHPSMLSLDPVEPYDQHLTRKLYGLDFDHPQPAIMPITPVPPKKEVNYFNQAVTKIGSHEINLELDTAHTEHNDELIDRIFTELMPFSIYLSRNMFGNYVVQKLLQVGSDRHSRLLADTIIPHTASLAFDLCASRVLQALISRSNEEIWCRIVDEIRPVMMDATFHKFGRFVVQRLVRHHVKGMSDLVQALSDPRMFVLAARGSHSCFVLQEMLTLGDPELLAPLLPPLASSARLLAKDQTGNYVVQAALRNKQLAYERVYDSLLPDILPASMGKFSSNVVERLVERCDQEHLETLVPYMMASPLFERIVFDRYGSFVVEKLLLATEKRIRMVLLEAVKWHFMHSGTRSVPAQHLLQKCQQLCPQFVDMTPRDPRSLL